MCVLNDLDRFHLVSDVIDRVPRLGARAAYAKQAIRDKLVGRTTVPGCDIDSHSACYKTSVRSLYAESFSSQAHLDTIVVQPQEIVGRALAG